MRNINQLAHEDENYVLDNESLRSSSPMIYTSSIYTKRLEEIQKLPYQVPLHRHSSSTQPFSAQNHRVNIPDDEIA